MDTVTQFVLGAAVGVAVMGREQPIVKSAIIGGLCGTLPDLDSFIDYGDPVLNMVEHRAETHSVFWQTMAAPFIASVVALGDRSLHLFFRWWILVWFALITHTGIDLMTVYGTQAFLPQSAMPLGLGSIFIIDPLYTLPLVFGLLLTFAKSSKRILKWNIIGLVISTAYLGWTYYAQQEVLKVVRQLPAAQGLAPENILVTPTPFNSVVWRVLLLREDRFQQAFYSLADRFVAPERELAFKSYRRGLELDKATAEFSSANQIRQFSKGFYALSEDAGKVRITDLRMGQEPFYVFSFEFARKNGRVFEEIPAASIGVAPADVPFRDLLKWIWLRMQGKEGEPPG